MYAEVLLNHSYSKIREILSYEIPESFKIKAGALVRVPFRNGMKAGVVINIHNKKPNFETKYLEEFLVPNIFLYDWQLKLAEWISEYYFCSALEVYKAFLPAALWKLKPVKKTGKEKKPQAKKLYHELNATQKKIVDTIIDEKIPASLIFGVTGSGKTEVYKNIIQSVHSAGKQSILLVPEISLTPQLVEYFVGNFPDACVIHSKLSEGEKVEAWKKIHNGECKLIIGSRSAIFSPLKNPGLIIVDEEHEWTYKQEQSPRYNTRDIAFKIAELTGAQLIFGSATPSVEIMMKAKTGEIRLFEMQNRIANTEMPKVEIVDLREEMKKGNYSMFSDLLLQKIEEKLSKKEQILIFLNRRGSASSTVCRDCGLALSCDNCDSKLTYHASKFRHATLICHHCGLVSKLPELCPNCKSARIKHFGVGTEKLESELKKLFPQAKIARADRDTMGAKTSFTKLHQDLKELNVDILIGTQMIGKGFDVAGISLVGVILADSGLHIPDFRAMEKNFQLLSQVSGRAGRRQKQGEVIIQTYSPDLPIFEAVKNHDYLSFYEQEIYARKGSGLPPFGKILKLIYVGKSQNESKQKCQSLLEKLSTIAGDDTEIFSAPAITPRINNKYFWNILIKGNDPRALIKKIDRAELQGFRIDVDPVQTV